MPSTTPAISSPRTGATSTNSWSMRCRRGRTSTNMNANEVVANLALELLGHRRGEYQFLHPIDDVNMAQSTNDAYPTALRLAVIFAAAPLAQALRELAYALKAKAVEFADVLKIGRTQLQDAVPMTLGQSSMRFTRR